MRCRSYIDDGAVRKNYLIRNDTVTRESFLGEVGKTIF